jgi:hypothetical protein
MARTSLAPIRPAVSMRSYRFDETTNIGAPTHSCFDIRPDADVVWKLLFLDLHTDPSGSCQESSEVARSSNKSLVSFNFPRFDRGRICAERP